MRNSNSGNYRIIILDDDTDLLYHAQYWLSKRGFTTLSFSKEEEVYDAMKDFSADLILIDIHLKTKDGRDVCKFIKQNMDYQKPVVLFSHRDYSDYDCRLCNATGFISKTPDYYTLANNLLPYLKKN